MSDYMESGELIWVNPKYAHLKQAPMHGGSAHGITHMFEDGEERVWVVCKRMFYREKPERVSTEVPLLKPLPVEEYHWDEQAQEFYLHDTWELT